MRYLLIICVLTLTFGHNLIAQCDDCYSTPFIGVYSNGISEKKAERLNFDNSEGSYITGIIGNTAAEKAGLQPFDYIFGVDEYRTDYGRSLTSILRKYDPGDKVTVHFYRNGKKQSTKMELGKRSDARYNKKNKSEDPFLGIEQIGKSWDDEYAGVRVNVVGNSTAENIGLEDKDIITHINGFPILDWTDVGAAIDMTEVGSQMAVTFIRDGKERKSSGTIRSYADSKSRSSSGQTRRTTDDDGNSRYSYHYDSDDYKNKTKVKIKNGKTSYTYHYDSDEGNNTQVTIVNGEKISEDYDSGKRNVEGMQVNLTDVSSTEISSFADRHDLNLSTNNNLAVSAIVFRANENKGNFELTFDLSNQGDTVVDIYNEEGRNIYNYELENFSGAFEDTVDLAQNGIGSYYLYIKQNGKSMVKEVVLSRR